MPTSPPTMSLAIKAMIPRRSEKLSKAKAPSRSFRREKHPRRLPAIMPSMASAISSSGSSSRSSTSGASPPATSRPHGPSCPSLALSAHLSGPNECERPLERVDIPGSHGLENLVQGSLLKRQGHSVLRSLTRAMASARCSAKCSKPSTGLKPRRRIMVRAVLRRAARTCGAFSERVRQWSSRQVTSRT